MGACISSSVGGDGIAHSSSAVKGSHDIHINGYSGTKGIGNGKYLKSEPFEIGGHRWYIRYYPDGNTRQGAGWISLFLHLYRNNAKGIQASFKFSLLDEVGEPVCWSNSGTITFKCRDSGWGYAKFLERKALEESPYLKNDCFRVRCDLTVFKLIRTKSASHFVTVPPSDMNQQIGRLLLSGVEADVMFQVGNETFGAHRLVLGARSKVFMAELLGPMKETNRHIRIQEMEPRVFKAMLHFIYTDEFPKMDKGDTFAMTQHLLVAAERYDLQRLKLMCEYKLCQGINTSTATTMLLLAEQHGCKGLKDACLNFLKKVMDGD